LALLGSCWYSEANARRGAVGGRGAGCASGIISVAFLVVLGEKPSPEKFTMEMLSDNPAEGNKALHQISAKVRKMDENAALDAEAL
jgi:hypothetical protein